MSSSPSLMMAGSSNLRSSTITFAAHNSWQLAPVARYYRQLIMVQRHGSMRKVGCESDSRLAAMGSWWPRPNERSHQLLMFVGVITLCSCSPASPAFLCSPSAGAGQSGFGTKKNHRMKIRREKTNGPLSDPRLSLDISRWRTLPAIPTEWSPAPAYFLSLVLPP